MHSMHNPNLNGLPHGLVVRIRRFHCLGPVHLYSLDGTSLKVVSSVKDLGVMVTKDLTWSNHVRYVTAKINHMLGFIKRNCAGIINKDALKLLYVSLVHSHLCHCSQVWTPQTSMLMMEVDKV